jgi:hypothetical protein
MNQQALPPDPDGQNDERAEWAAESIRTFARVTCMDTANEDDDTILGDLLCDLMHWCDREGIDFDAVLGAARENYGAETAD